MIINFFFKNTINFLFLYLISYSLYLGLTYTKYHIDPWHWGTIASEALDYINNFKLFKDITLMYGPGQAILFKIINNFYKIDYYSIGVITCLAYVVNLSFSFLIFKELSNKYLALLLIFCIISLLPYPQTPWPDFYSGLCTTLSCFFLISYQSKKSEWKIYLSAIFPQDPLPRVHEEIFILAADPRTGRSRYPFKLLNQRVDSQRVFQ